MMRNLEDQVQFLTEKINYWRTIEGLGIKILGVVNTEDSIPNISYKCGDAFFVGKYAPYELYIYIDGFVNFGLFPAPGPEGPMGIPGVKGEKGDIGITGKQGKEGKQGPIGIGINTLSSINTSNGTPTVTYSNGVAKVVNSGVLTYNVNSKKTVDTVFEMPIEASYGINISANNDGNAISISVSDEFINKINNSIQFPDIVEGQKLVSIMDGKRQDMLEVGDGLKIEGNTLKTAYKGTLELISSVTVGSWTKLVIINRDLNNNLFDLSEAYIVVEAPPTGYDNYATITLQSSNGSNEDVVYGIIYKIVCSNVKRVSTIHAIVSDGFSMVSGTSSGDYSSTTMAPISLFRGDREWNTGRISGVEIRVSDEFKEGTVINIYGRKA